MSGLLSDAELHGLIDGQIEMHHRADILRRAAASTTDRERIGSWQTQGEMIRAAFIGIDREPLPSVLDLRAPARLHAVPAVRAGVLEDVPPIMAVERSRSRLVLPTFAALIAAGGLLATWAAGGFSTADPEPAAAVVVIAGGDTKAVPVASMAPAATIPDLSTLGFTLAGVDVLPGPPASIQFQYRNADAGRLRLAVSRADGPATGAVAPIGKALVWRAGHRSYALTGDLGVEEMRAVAPSVRVLALDE